MSFLNFNLSASTCTFFKACAEALADLYNRFNAWLFKTKKAARDSFESLSPKKPAHVCTASCGIAGCFHSKPPPSAFQKMRGIFSGNQGFFKAKNASVSEQNERLAHDLIVPEAYQYDETNQAGKDALDERGVVYV
jgi:hypothetical protein